jgi:uncharacterized protein with GYD domain
LENINNRRWHMAKYLFHASYTEAGLKGLLKEGGSSRREAVAQALKGLGGSVEAFYYAFGDTDVFLIVDLPDNISTLAASLIINAAGTAKVKTTVLVTPEEVDEATKKSVDYRPAGQ